MSRSPLERLRARYDELDARSVETVCFPVGHGLTDVVDEESPDAVGIAVEYREPDWLRNKEINDKWRRSDDERSEIYSAAEQLAFSCVDILIRDDENGTERHGLPGKWLTGLGAGEGKIGFSRAALLLGRNDGKDGIEAVFAVMGRKDSPAAEWEVDRHMKFLAIWEPGASPEVDEAFAGESEAAQPSSQT